MKKILAFVLSLMLVLSMASVASAEEPKILRVGFAYDAYTLDASMATDDAAYQTVRLMVEPLLRLVDGQPVPGIAESWDVSDDAKVWTFHLRESVYSDGTPVTAEDFRYQIIRTLDPNNALEQATSFYGIVGGEEFNAGTATAEDVGVEVVDDYTLKITLKNPGYERDFTGYPMIPVEQAFCEPLGQEYGASAENVLTNGPFTVVDWVYDSQITLVKNPNYWNADAINLDEIHIMAGAANDTAVDMMLSDQLDAAEFTDQKCIDAVVESGNFYNIKYYNGLQFIHLNHHGLTEETGKWLSNVNFRKALNAAIDREALAATIYTTDLPASSIIGPDEMGVEKPLSEEYDTGSWSTKQDVEAANAYLQAAMEELGATDVSEIPTFTMLAFDSQGNIICLNAIADMWNKALGITCELDMAPIMDMLDKVNAGKFDFWKGGIPVDGDSFGQPLSDYSKTDGSTDALIYEEDLVYDEMFEEIAQRPTWEGRKSGIAELARYYTENMLDLAVTWSGMNAVAHNNVTGITTDNGYVDYTFADITIG